MLLLQSSLRILAPAIIVQSLCFFKPAHRARQELKHFLLSEIVILPSHIRLLNSSKTK